jgi:hypothetical protein
VLIVVYSLFESLKEAPNFPRNVSKSFIKGDYRSKRGANHAKFVLDYKVLMSLTWVWSSNNNVDEVG